MRIKATAVMFVSVLLLGGMTARAEPVTSDDKALAAHATTLGDADFEALKMRMKPKVTSSCPVTTAQGVTMQASPATCQCIGDAYFKQVNKADFEKFSKTRQVRLDANMQAAQKACLLDLPTPVAPRATASSDDRYAVLQTLQNDCIADAQKSKKNVSIVQRNLCGCLATKRTADMKDADIAAFRKGERTPMDPRLKNQMVSICKKK